MKISPFLLAISLLLLTSNCWFNFKKSLTVPKSTYYGTFYSCGYDNDLFMPAANGSLMTYDKEVISVPKALVFPSCFRFMHELDDKRKYILMRTPINGYIKQASKMPGLLYRVKGDTFTKIDKFPAPSGYYLINGALNPDYVLFVLYDTSGTVYVVAKLSEFDSENVSLDLNKTLKIEMSQESSNMLSMEKEQVGEIRKHPSVQDLASSSFVGGVYGDFLYWSSTNRYAYAYPHPDFKETAILVVDDTYNVNYLYFLDFQDVSTYSSSIKQSKFSFTYYEAMKNITIRRFISFSQSGQPTLSDWQVIDLAESLFLGCQDRNFSFNQNGTCLTENSKCVINVGQTGYCQRQHSAFGGKAKINFVGVPQDDPSSIVISVYEESRLALLLFIIGMSVLGVILIYFGVFAFLHFKKGVTFKEYATCKVCTRSNQDNYNPLQR